MCLSLVSAHPMASLSYSTSDLCPSPLSFLLSGYTLLCTSTEVSNKLDYVYIDYCTLSGQLASEQQNTVCKYYNSQSQCDVGLVSQDTKEDREPIELTRALTCIIELYFIISPGLCKHFYMEISTIK